MNITEKAIVLPLNTDPTYVYSHINSTKVNLMSVEVYKKLQPWP